MKPYTLVWQPAAVAGLVRVRTTDPAVAKAVRAAVASLADDPRPTDSTMLGSAGLRRLRIGEARVLYEIDDVHAAVRVILVGRTPGP